MFAVLKQDLSVLRSGESGRRFLDLYDYRQSGRTSGFSIERAATIFFGLILVIGGALIGWLPGPGGFIAIFGFALLAQEFRPMAVALDWCEEKLRFLWTSAVKFWNRMSVLSRVILATVVIAKGCILVYAAYLILMQ